MNKLRIGPFTLDEVRVVYDRTMVQLAGGATVCANGDIIVYWSRLTDATSGNEAYFLRSCDQGHTWEMTGQPLASENEEGSVHVATGMVTLEDGTILLPFADYQSGRRDANDHPRYMKNRRRPSVMKVAISRDHGRHWDRIVTINLPQFGWVYPYGRIFKGLDGLLCLPLTAGPTNCLGEGWEKVGTESGFLISRDQGRTWGEWQAIVPFPNPENCGETSIARCADGSLLALHRNNNPRWLQSRSVDDGKKWTISEPTELFGECGCLFSLPDGTLLAAYRRSEKAPAALPVGLHLVYSEDNGRTWTPPVVIPDPKGRKHQAWHEVGMPDIVQLTTGQIAIIYYSFDPNLPWQYPLNDQNWKSVSHFYKRYLAMAVLS
jgi:hypothetical protein